MIPIVHMLRARVTFCPHTPGTRQPSDWGEVCVGPDIIRVVTEVRNKRIVVLAKG